MIDNCSHNEESKKTIAIVANTSWNIINFRFSLINKLVENKFKVIVIATGNEDDKKFFLKNNIPFFQLKHLTRKGTNPIKDFKLIQELKTIYKSQHVDIAIQYTIKPNIYGSLAAHKIGVKTISNLTGLGYVFLKNSLKNSLVKKLYKYGLSKTHITCFHNHIDAQLFQSMKLVAPEKINIIEGSGVNTHFFQFENRLENKNFIFLFIGRFLFDKGIIELFNAFDTLYLENKNIELHLLGDIDHGNPSSISIEMLENYKKNSNVFHHGIQQNVKPFINQSDAVVLPSYREGLPKSLLEAMSMQRPIITVNSVGCNNLIVENSNGFLAQVKSTESLYLKMKDMAALSIEKREEMGKAGRELVITKYSEEIINNQYLNLISQLNV